MDKIEQLENLVKEVRAEGEKFYEKKNKSAGTRLRKKLMEIKNLTHEMRSEVTEAKNGTVD